MKRINKYASHLPVLEAIFKFRSINTVFEYGCGYYSTKFFVDHAKEVESIEMCDATWYERVEEEFGKRKNLSLKCMLGRNCAIDYFRNNGKNYDLIFVDGFGKTRSECVEHAFNRAPIIVVHDFGNYASKKLYHNGIFNLPESYKFVKVCKANPCTGVYTNDLSLYNGLVNWR